MIYSSLLSFTIWALCALPSEASWFRRSAGHAVRVFRSPGDTNHKTQGLNSNKKLSTRVSSYYTYSLPGPHASPTSQNNTLFTTRVAAYEVCNPPGLNSSSNDSSCSTAFQNITTTSCSTVLTAWFSSVTVTDCDQNITFSTQSSYSLATETSSAVALPSVPVGQVSQQTSTTYVQSVVSYYIAPWQSLAANTPNNVTVLICKYDQNGQKSCQEIKEVWIVHTEYVPVTSTSTLSISTSFTKLCSFSRAAILLLGPSQNITVPTGSYQLSTEIEYTSMTPNATTLTSTIFQDETSTASLTITVTILGKTTTITKTAQTRGRADANSTTSFISTTHLTSMVTVLPLPRQ
ncbi:hypothetical protein LSUE1_G002399 [Lachnellula suecica]|uniref:Uncharacterized protein n=1 Tax=Lachnellula suecica TaxID=602035 RepID=A0A8T9C7T9_9HELO|nr:hypothetical protein LSUE1_G002399 [Lachnellula suecica]